MTEDANRKATSAKEQAAQATQDALDKGQAHGESAWQKAKDAASHVYETVHCQHPHFLSKMSLFCFLLVPLSSGSYLILR